MDRAANRHITERPKERRTVLVSFSGIDGAGKSTQIEELASRMTRDGWRVRVIRFWDDIARLKGIREASGHRIFKGDKGVGTPSAPIHRRDKNVQSGLMTCIRVFLYFVDAMSTRLTAGRALRSGLDLVIFDRYTYDELANLNRRNPILRAYARTLVALAPRPDISYLLDADPAQAHARKPEYPLEFVDANRKAYLALADLVGGMTVIPPMAVEDVEAEVAWQVLEKLAGDPLDKPPDGWVVQRRA
jgi:thymidylate kinase